MKNYLYLLFYHYRDIDEVDEMCSFQRAICTELGLHGRIRVASEGINGLVGGWSEPALQYKDIMDKLSEDYVASHPGSRPMQWNISGLPLSQKQQQDSNLNVDEWMSELTLTSLSVAKTQEVVSMDAPLSVREAVKSTPGGCHLTPTDFHDLLEGLSNGNLDASEYCLVDLRNHYEVDIGRFEVPSSPPEKGTTEVEEEEDDSLVTRLPTINPETRQFSEITQFFDDRIDELRGRKVIMYCTGGVRCERGSSYLRYKGIDEVYQLQGGIHSYQQTFPDGGFFKGKNFVFDPRIALSAENFQGARGSNTSSGQENIALPQEHTSSMASSIPLMQEPRETVIVGRCLGCEVPFDDYSSKQRCSHCRMLILLCEDCQVERKRREQMESRENAVDDNSSSSETIMSSSSSNCKARSQSHPTYLCRLCQKRGISK